MGHKHPQVGNTVTCPVCNDNGDRFYTQMGRKCQQCSQWLSSKEDCSLCTAKHFKEFTKQTKPAEHKVYVQRLETATRPVTKDLAFNRVASFHTEPEPEPESESDSQEHEQEREVKVDPKNPPPIPKPEPQPKQEEPKQEEPKQELKKEEVKTDVNISVVVEQGKSLIKVVAFEKTALMQVDFIGFSMNQVNGKTFVTSNGQTFAVETDPVKKTIAFVF
jgi:outer membrane biosynthesis protein TonB